MTKSFNRLFETLLVEMMPVEMGVGPDVASSKIKSSAEQSEGKGHWAPLRDAEGREEITNAIIAKVFREKGNTYSSDIHDKDQLHSAIQKAIQELAQENGTFKAGGKWASKFLADRIVTTLKPFLTFTTTSGEVVKKTTATQKEVKQALNKALEKAAKAPVETAKAEAAKRKPKSGDSSEDSSEGKYAPTGFKRQDAVFDILSYVDKPGLPKDELVLSAAEAIEEFWPVDSETGLPVNPFDPDAVKDGPERKKAQEKAQERARHLIDTMIKNMQLEIDPAGFVTMKEDNGEDNGEAGELDIEDETPEDYEAAKDRALDNLRRGMSGGRTQLRDSGYEESFERVLQRYESVL